MGYRRWSAGAFLPALFLTDAYLAGFDGYDLDPHCRNASGALLVNVYTSEVMDVAYGVFWS